MSFLFFHFSMNKSFDLNNAEDRRAYILNSWEETAALAYAGYKAYQRGAVVFARGCEKPMYVPLLGNDFGNPSAMQALRDYDAEKEIIVLFYLGEPQPIVERISVEQFPPPQAFMKYNQKADR